MDSDALLSSRAHSTVSSVIRDLLRLVDRPDMLSLAGGLPAPEHLPVARIAEALARVRGTRVGGTRALQYGPTEGMVELREVVAGRLRCPINEIVICTGSQQGLDLVARSLLDPGDLVVVADPSYLGSLQSFRAAGAELHAVASDEDGLDVEALGVVLESGLRPKLVSVVTDFANPTGATLSAARRRRLLELAVGFGFVVVEDNPYGELRWAGEAEPSLGALAAGTPAADLVVTLGSASKVLAPGLRLGWLRGPAWLTDAVVRLKQSSDLHTSSLDQLLAADVLGDTAFMEAHLGLIRADYCTRPVVLAEALSDFGGGRIEAALPDGGMFVWARLTDGSSSSDLFDRALGEGVSFVPGAAFSPGFSPDGRPSDRLRMCFTTLRPDELRAAVSRLVRALPR